MLRYCIQVSKHYKVSSNMLQSQFIFYKGSGITSLLQWETKFDIHIFAFPSGYVKRGHRGCAVGTLTTVCVLYTRI